MNPNKKQKLMLGSAWLFGVVLLVYAVVADYGPETVKPISDTVSRIPDDNYLQDSLNAAADSIRITTLRSIEDNNKRHAAYLNQHKSK